MLKKCRFALRKHENHPFLAIFAIFGNSVLSQPTIRHIPTYDLIITILSFKVKYFGRRCCSPCCTGAFIVEVMLAVITNADVDELEFKSDLKSVIYRLV